jgi:hypothetical protein
MLGFSLLCLLAGIVPGVVIDCIAPVAPALTGSRMPVQLGDIWMTIAPVAASRSSYSGTNPPASPAPIKNLAPTLHFAAKPSLQFIAITPVG